jgi:NAD(P)-dependent dehydrogenase (short-subunit alcohol dehydrogenase family)
VTTRQRVAVVTGGGGGIGGAIAESLGRTGWFVVTVDPMVTLEGTEELPEPETTTAGRIVAAGGAARASSASVTDGEALRALFADLAAERGGLDAVVNVAGITRQSFFARGTEEDWTALLSVHLGGYLNVLDAALPLMAEAGYGRIVGVTSGSGWRAADAGGYSCAKRAVAALTWQLGARTPPGVTVNALSPIANTRMVAAALERARQEGRAGGGGGLSLDAMPGPDQLGPLGAHLVEDSFGWCTGQVVFASGPETAIVDQPRLMEVVRTTGAASLRTLLAAFVPRALAKAEANQASAGGGNPRFARIFDEPAPDPAPAAAAVAAVKTCAVIADGRPELAAPLIAALEARSITCHRVGAALDFTGAADALRAAIDRDGNVDAIVLALDAHAPVASTTPEWASILADHHGIVEHLHADAAWSRAAADYAALADHPIRLVTLTAATSAAGRSRAQAAAQLARVAAGATEGRVTAFAVGVEAPDAEAGPVVGELVAHLLAESEAPPLAGAELVVGPGWLGLRSHPRPLGTLTYGGPDVPDWIDDVFRDMVAAAAPAHEMEAR